MAIVQISRIQHRKGLRVDLPQLSSAELGWAVDEQKLFIGNGSLAEGAPFLGNTEILTEHSDLLGTAAPYTFQGNSILQTADTKADGSDVTRSLQDRLDDYVSIRAFGVDGIDGNAVQEAINFALAELYGRGFDKQTRIALYIPAGVYKITEPIELPPYAMVYGDGKGRTIIYNATTGKAVFKVVDAAGNSGAGMGTDLVVADGEELPNGIFVQGITFEHTNNADLSEILSATDLTFVNCEFKGSYTNLTSTSSQTAFSFLSEVATPSQRIKFHLCTFRQLGFALEQAEALVGGASFSQCDFVTLYKGIQTTDGGDGYSDAITVQNCVFNGISQEAMKAEDGAKIVSMGNHYINCANGGTGSSVTEVLKFGSDGCVSWADNFERPANDANSRIAFTATKYTYMDPADRFSWGHKDQLTTARETLADGDSGSLSVTFDPTDNHQAEIMYTITRSGHVQSGTLTIAIYSGRASISDNYTYTGSSDAGVIFSLTETAGLVTINWVTTTTGDDAVITIAPVTIKEL